MELTSIQKGLVIAVCFAFGVAGIVQVTGPAFVRRSYRRWGYLSPVYRFMGVLELMAAASIAILGTREVGIWFAGAINFVAVVSLLKNREYRLALPGLAVSIALPIALVATLYHA